MRSCAVYDRGARVEIGDHPDHEVLDRIYNDTALMTHLPGDSLIKAAVLAGCLSRAHYRRAHGPSQVCHPVWLPAGECRRGGVYLGRAAV